MRPVELWCFNTRDTNWSIVTSVVTKAKTMPGNNATKHKGHTHDLQAKCLVQHEKASSAEASTILLRKHAQRRGEAVQGQWLLGSHAHSPSRPCSYKSLSLGCRRVAFNCTQRSVNLMREA